MQMRKVGAKEDIHYIFVKTGLAQVSHGSEAPVNTKHDELSLTHIHNHQSDPRQTNYFKTFKIFTKI